MATAQETLQAYDKTRLSVATLGSHSALDICRGAKDEGFRTLVVCQSSRSEVYDKYYRTNGSRGCVDETIILPDFKQIVSPEVVQKLAAANAIFVPHRSFAVYVGYPNIASFKVPIFGNRALLQAEERSGSYKIEKNQDWLLARAGIPTPKKFASPQEIDRSVIVKVSRGSGAKHFKREFFVVDSATAYQRKIQELLSEGLTTEEQVRSATVEEFIDGPKLNFNFFYSPLSGELELLGIDTRTQATNGEELSHAPASLKESLLQKVFPLGEALVKTTQKEFAPGIIGPFALQCVFRGEDPVVYDVSFRIPGSPDTEFTPYSGYLFGEAVSFGRRIAMEIKEAQRQGQLAKLLT